MNFTGNVFQLLMDHEKDILMAGLMSAVPLIMAMFVVGVFVIVMSGKKDWLGKSDRFHRLATILLVVELALVSIPLAGVAGAMDGAARRAATIVGEHAEDMNLTKAAGAVLLAVSFHVHTNGGKDKAAIAKLEEHGVEDLRLFANPEVQRTIVSQLDEETVRTISKRVAGELRKEDVSAPAWMVDMAIEGVEEGMANSLEMHGDLLSHLKPLSDGSLPQEQAFDQVGCRFFQAHVADVSERALGSKPALLGFLAFFEFFFLFGLLALIGKKKEADHID